MKLPIWTKFNVYENIQAAYKFDNGEVIIKLITKVPRGMYYSFLNDAGEYFDKNIKPNIN